MAKEKEKDAVFAAAQELFARKGPNETTLDDIAKEAKVDLKQVKALYPSPDKILEEMIGKDIEESSELFTKVINDRGKADIKLTRLVRELLMRYQKSYFLFKVIGMGVDETNEDDEFVRRRIRDEYVDRYRQNTAILGRLIAQGQSENLFTDIDPLEAAYLLRGMISSALRYRRLTRRDDDIRDYADRIMRIFLKGLLR